VATGRGAANALATDRGVPAAAAAVKTYFNISRRPTSIMSMPLLGTVSQFPCSQSLAPHLRRRPLAFCLHQTSGAITFLLWDGSLNPETTALAGHVVFGGRSVYALVARDPADSKMKAGLINVYPGGWRQALHQARYAPSPRRARIPDRELLHHHK
jgi:hypothetical protein